MTTMTTTGGTKLFGREPALVIGAVASVLQMLTLLFHLSEAWQGAANALIVALAGALTAGAVAAEKAAALWVGVAKAIVALAIAWGMHLDPNIQVALMAIVTAFASFYVRTQVVAPVPAPQLKDGTFVVTSVGDIGTSPRA